MVSLACCFTSFVSLCLCMVFKGISLPNTHIDFLWETIPSLHRILSRRDRRNFWAEKNTRSGTKRDSGHEENGCRTTSGKEVDCRRMTRRTSILLLQTCYPGRKCYHGSKPLHRPVASIATSLTLPSIQPQALSTLPTTATNPPTSSLIRLLIPDHTTDSHDRERIESAV